LLIGDGDQAVVVGVACLSACCAGQGFNDTLAQAVVLISGSAVVDIDQSVVAVVGECHAPEVGGVAVGIKLGADAIVLVQAIAVGRIDQVVGGAAVGEAGAVAITVVIIIKVSELAAGDVKAVECVVGVVIGAGRLCVDAGLQVAIGIVLGVIQGEDADGVLLGESVGLVEALAHGLAVTIVQVTDGPKWGVGDVIGQYGKLTTLVEQDLGDLSGGVILVGDEGAGGIGHAVDAACQVVVVLHALMLADFSKTIIGVVGDGLRVGDGAELADTIGAGVILVGGIVCAAGGVDGCQAVKAVITVGEQLSLGIGEGFYVARFIIAIGFAAGIRAGFCQQVAEVVIDVGGGAVDGIGDAGEAIGDVVAILSEDILGIRVGTVLVLGDGGEAFEFVVAVLADLVVAVDLTIEGAIGVEVIVADFIELSGDVEAVVGVEGLAQGFLQDVVGVIDGFVGLVAFGVEGVLDSVTQAIGDAGQATGVVVAEGDGGGVGGAIGGGDGFDFAGGQVGPTGGTVHTAGTFGGGLQAVVAGVVGVGDDQSIRPVFAQHFAGGGVLDVVTQDDAFGSGDTFYARAVVAFGLGVGVVIEIGDVIDGGIGAWAVDFGELVQRAEVLHVDGATDGGAVGLVAGDVDLGGVTEVIIGVGGDFVGASKDGGLGFGLDFAKKTRVVGVVGLAGLGGAGGFDDGAGVAVSIIVAVGGG